jgi:hypothetical protein
VRKSSYFIWLLILASGAFIAGIELFPKGASQATSANMAYMGLGAVLASLFLIILFPLVSLAYLFNWQHLLHQTSKPDATKVSSWRFVEAILFFVSALCVGYLWASNAWQQNDFITLLEAISTLPIVLFGVLNGFKCFSKNAQATARSKKIVLVFFITPAILLAGFIGVCYYQNYQQQLAANQQKIADCNQRYRGRIQHQLDRQYEEIIKSDNLEDADYYKKLPKRPFELSLYLSYGLPAYSGDSTDYENLKLHEPNAAWTLEILSVENNHIKPQLVLTGKSDAKGLIQADLANYPQVRSALEHGRSLLLGIAKGSVLLQGYKENSGELVLGVIGDSFLDKHPVNLCNNAP